MKKLQGREDEAIQLKGQIEQLRLNLKNRENDLEIARG